MYFFFPTASSEPTARYLIVQHLPDPFRREARNVGVVVEKEGKVAARFLGESDSGAWTLSRPKGMPNTNVYRLWVDRWRKVIRTSGESWADHLRSEISGQFLIIPGGEVSQTGADAAEEVCQHLYSLLISSGGYAEAMADYSIESPSIALRRDMAAEFEGCRLVPWAAPCPGRPIVDRNQTGAPSFVLSRTRRSCLGD